MTETQYQWPQPPEADQSPTPDVAQELGSIGFDGYQQPTALSAHRPGSQYDHLFEGTAKVIQEATDAVAPTEAHKPAAATKPEDVDDKYDKLFEPEVEDPNAPAARARAWAEAEPTWREAQLFRPLHTATEAAKVEVNYDHLFDPIATEPEQPQYGGIETSGEWGVTERTREAAVKQLARALHADESLGKLLADYNNGEPANYDQLPDVVDTLRMDPTVRTAAGKYFLGKLEAFVDQYPTAVPDQIARNFGKSVARGTKPLADLKSREYAALLCLAKVDGTFDEARLSDKIEIGNDGLPIVGQHRYMADLLLNDYKGLGNGDYVWSPSNTEPTH